MGRATFRLWASGMNRKASPEKIREKAVMLRGSTRLRRKPHINWAMQKPRLCMNRREVAAA